MYDAYKLESAHTHTRICMPASRAVRIDMLVEIIGIDFFLIVPATVTHVDSTVMKTFSITNKLKNFPNRKFRNNEKITCHIKYASKLCGLSAKH